jgi:hypothetical protein
MPPTLSQLQVCRLAATLRWTRRTTANMSPTCGPQLAALSSARLPMAALAATMAFAVTTRCSRRLHAFATITSLSHFAFHPPQRTQGEPLRAPPLVASLRALWVCWPTPYTCGTLHPRAQGMERLRQRLEEMDSTRSMVKLRLQL